MQSMGVFWISYIVLWVVVSVQAVLILALGRLVGQLTRRNPPTGARVINPGPEIGSRVEDWSGVDLLGKEFEFRFPRGRGAFLLYTSPHCTVCESLVPSARRFFEEIAPEAEGVWVMVLGSRDAQLAYAREHGLTRHVLLAEDQLPRSWQVQGAPFGLWIDAGGVVKSKGMTNNRDHLESLRNAAEMGHPSIQSYLAAAAESRERPPGGSAEDP
jgi:methylamine dehydrogenase accessory protein MauD